MQLINCPDDEKFPYVVDAIQLQRLSRYMPAANNKRSDAFALYLWNCALGESFFVALHFAEIICRNAIHRRLLGRLGDSWFEHVTFRSILGARHRDDLDSAIREERLQHGDRFSADHVVSALAFGFWQHLLTRRFDRLLWPQGVHVCFPNAPSRATREDIYLLVESVRRWRNRIAHHHAIFDKSPMKKHQDALNLIVWSCGSTGAWVSGVSRVPRTIELRPL